MLISAVLPIMSLYKLPHGQYAYSGHVINLPQDVASFANSLPRLHAYIHTCTVNILIITLYFDIIQRNKNHTHVCELRLAPSLDPRPHPLARKKVWWILSAFLDFCCFEVR